MHPWNAQWRFPLYLRIWIAVIAAVSVLTFAFGWLWQQNRQQQHRHGEHPFRNDESVVAPITHGTSRSAVASKSSVHAGMSIGDIDLVEINEAFAAQVVPSYQDLGIDIDRLNVNGGSIAVGHPFGMTGARLQNTMLNSLDWHDKTTGLITMCVGGGQGMALILERLG